MAHTVLHKAKQSMEHARVAVVADIDHNLSHNWTDLNEGLSSGSQSLPSPEAFPVGARVHVDTTNHTTGATLTGWTDTNGNTDWDTGTTNAQIATLFVIDNNGTKEWRLHQNDGGSLA